MAFLYSMIKNVRKMKRLTAIAMLAVFTACGGNSQPKEKEAPATSGQPAAAAEAPTATKSPDAAPTASFTCLLNGKEWNGRDIFNGHLYYAKGIAQMYGGKPYMMLSFRATDAPDNRQLNISFMDFQGKPGVYSKEKLEVLLSGAASGEAQQSEMQGHKVPGQATDFTVELTEWKQSKGDEVLVSGKVQGTLKGVFGSPAVKIENGTFSNVAVKMFNEKY
jgi:hypothetical protein